ncbi:ankyrin repeat-containing domain protein [Lasiosphaeria hispida]|uniref:Ankyrin repeat-containing domain protein n=1 Tax=Lasiosphaeria hispida TaxID=260671 RepID=A0AAJ0ME34_9PEZI|nr:ankyrin repeat-containing domain protein [Lasiosphaeria hispida]
MQAVKLKNLAAVETLLNQNLDPNFRLSDNEPYPLKLAVKNDDLAMVQRLCSRGARADYKTQSGKTLLMLAIENNCINSALGLIPHSALSLTDAQGRTALHMAAKGNHLALAEELLKANANPNTQTADGRTPLHEAATSGDTALAAALLQEGADPTIPDSTGKQPLHHAASSGHEALAIQLLTHSSSSGTTAVPIDAPDTKGITPLMLAAGSGHDALVHRLACAGADVRRRSAMGFHALYAACAGGHLLCAAYLLGRGAEVDGADCRGNTPLHVAAKNGRVEMVRWLVSMGADRGRRSVEPFEGLAVVGTAAEVARGVPRWREGGVGEGIAALLEGWRVERRREFVWEFGVVEGKRAGQDG